MFPIILPFVLPVIVVKIATGIIMGPWGIIR